jgi:hypothetical protein
MLIINDRHLYRLIDEDVAYYNQARPHQGLGRRIPDPARTDNDPVGDKGAADHVSPSVRRAAS